MYSAPSGSGVPVADPLLGRGDYGLAGANVDDAALVLDSEQTSQHDRDLLELGPLPGLLPATGRDHTRDANSCMPRVYAARVLLDSFRLGARGLDDRRGVDECRHESSIVTQEVGVAARSRVGLRWWGSPTPSRRTGSREPRAASRL